MINNKINNKYQYLLFLWFILMLLFVTIALKYHIGGIYFIMFIAMVWPIAIYIFDKDFRNSIFYLNKKPFLFFLLYLFVLSGLITSIMSEYGKISFSYYISYILCFCICISFNYCVNDKQMSKALAMYSIVGSFFLVWYLFGEGAIASDRLGGLYNPNAIGMIAMSISLTSILFLNGFIKLFSTCIGGITLFLCNSRTSIIALILGIIIYYIIRPKARNRGAVLYLKNSILILSCAITLIIIAMFYENISNLLLSQFAINDPYRGISSGGSGRLDVWGEALDIFYQNPFFGVGFRVHEELMKSTLSAHNGFIATLADTGLIGFTVIISIIAVSIKKSFNNIDENVCVAGIVFIFSYLIIACCERYLINIGNPVSLIFLIFLFRPLVGLNNNMIEVYVDLEAFNENTSGV